MLDKLKTVLYYCVFIYSLYHNCFVTVTQPHSGGYSQIQLKGLDVTAPDNAGTVKYR